MKKRNYLNWNLFLKIRHNFKMRYIIFNLIIQVYVLGYCWGSAQLGAHWWRTWACWSFSCVLFNNWNTDGSVHAINQQANQNSIYTNVVSIWDFPRLFQIIAGHNRSIDFNHIEAKSSHDFADLHSHFDFRVRYCPYLI